MADTANNAIRQITPQGEVTTIGGGHGRGIKVSSRLALPARHIAYSVWRLRAVQDTGRDPDEIDRWRSSEWELKQTKFNWCEPCFVAGPILCLFRDRCRPYAICVDPLGRVLIADSENNRIRR